MVHLAVLDQGAANQEMIRQLGLLEPRLQLTVVAKIPEKEGYDGLLIIDAANFEAMGQRDDAKARTIVEVIKEWGYIGVVDMGMKYPKGSRKAGMEDATLSILSPRDAGFEHQQWPQKILKDLQDSFPEQLLGRRRD